MWKVCRSTFTVMSYISILLILDSLLLLCMKIGSMHTNMICMTYVISVHRYRSGKKGIGGPVYVHYRNVIMSAMVSEIIGVSIVCTIVCSGADKRKIKVPRHWPLWGVFIGDRWITHICHGNVQFIVIDDLEYSGNEMEAVLTTYEGVDVNNTHLSMINPDYNMMQAFPFVATNILLIISKLKLESRAIAVGVAMSPRNLGGKYRCRPHHRPQTCTRQFFCGNHSVLIELHQSGVIAWRRRRLCGVFKSWISVAHCPFERKWRVLHIWYISVLEQVGMSFDGMKV